MNESGTHPTVKAIRDRLDAQGISNLEFARRLGWGRMQVQRRLSGETDLTVIDLEEIAVVLGVPVSELVQPASAA